MEKWRFNMLLLSNLTEVLEISGAEIARRCSMKQPVLNRYLTGEIGLSVQSLMQICNALRMPVRHFLSQGDVYEIPQREYATVAPDRWRPVEWDQRAVESTFGDGEGRVFWKDVAEAMGVSPQKPHDRFLLKTRFPVDDFLKTCSRLDLSPFRFLVDRNGECKESQAEGLEPDDGIRHDILALRRSIDDLNRTVDDLTEKYKALLGRHNRLEIAVRKYLGYDLSAVASEDGPR